MEMLKLKKNVVISIQTYLKPWKQMTTSHPRKQTKKKPNNHPLIFLVPTVTSTDTESMLKKWLFTWL